MRAFGLFKKSKKHTKAVLATIKAYDGMPSEEKYKKAKELFENYSDEQSLQLSINLLIDSADNGYVESQLQVGILLFDGLIFKPDYSLAFKYLSMAASQNNYEACYNLGIFYHNGFGVPHDEGKAFEMFSKSADGGFPLGIHQVGAYYFEGLFVDKDEEKAIKLFEKAAEKDCVESLIVLGNYYYNIEEDEKSYTYLKRAADLGSKEALEYLNDEVYDEFN